VVSKAEAVHRAVIEVLNELVARNAALGLLEVLRQVAA
jgi:hypothetical protein